MSTTVLRSVTNLDGTIVKISDVPEQWWSENFASGFADPRHIAPDPDQPRKIIVQARLDELYESIKEKGVREPILVTPRHLAPWARVEKNYEHAYFLIVSGHRRWRGAGLASLEAIPFRIVIYKNEADHREDAALLNGIRENLNELEQGHEFVRLIGLGRTYAQISGRFVVSAATIQNYINLTKLHPDLQRLLYADVKKKQRLPLYPAYFLGGMKTPTAYELERLFEKFGETVTRREVIPVTDIDELNDDGRRFAMQKLFVRIITKRGLNAARATDLVRDQKLSIAVKYVTGTNHAVERSSRHEPRKRKDVLLNVFKQVTQSTIIDWTVDEFRRIFENASREDMDAVLVELREAGTTLAHVERILTVIREAKRPTRPEVVALMQRRKANA